MSEISLTSKLFPYTALFRSRLGRDRRHRRRPDLPPDHELAPGFGDPRQLERAVRGVGGRPRRDRKSTRLNSSHLVISSAVFCLNKTTQESDQNLNEPTLSDK